LQRICTRLRAWCDETAALGCVLDGDFNIELPGFAQTDYGGFQRLDPDKRVRRDGCRIERPHPHQRSEEEANECAGRRRYGDNNRKGQKDVDHLLYYQPEGSPLVARRPRRFRMYDRRRAGVLPWGAGAVTSEHDGALDHDALLLELSLDFAGTA